RRNHTAIRKALWKHGLMVDSEDCGGSVPRTMYVNVTDGRVMLKRKPDPSNPAPANKPTAAQANRSRVAGGVASRRPRLNLAAAAKPNTDAVRSPMRIGT
ncbi:MAG: hypothetical protein AAF743_02685, partial [Planctomycetota bacterium]